MRNLYTLSETQGISLLMCFPSVPMYEEWYESNASYFLFINCNYRGAHKSLARPGKKQATATKL